MITASQAMANGHGPSQLANPAPECSDDENATRNATAGLSDAALTVNQASLLSEAFKAGDLVQVVTLGMRSILI